MLTQKDIDFMRQARSEAIHGRTTPITLHYQIDNGVDEWTGEPLLETIELPVDAIVTELQADNDFKVEDGFTVEKAHINVSIDFQELEGYAEEAPQFLTYRSEVYKVLAVDRKGIGSDNRFELAAQRGVDNGSI